MTRKQFKQQEGILTMAHNDFQKLLNAYAAFKVHDQALGEDLVEKAFIKVWIRLASGGKIDLMKAFLYHILNDLIVDEYRKHKTTSLDVLLDRGFKPKSGDEDRLFDSLDGKAALLMIERLPLLYRKVMHLKYVDDLSIKEIASKTHRSKNAVTVQSHRGLEKLKLLYIPAKYSLPTAIGRRHRLTS